jgi:membrane protein
VSLVRCFMARDLLTYASAVGFQVLFALVPLALAAVALLGFLGLEDAWTEELAPQVQEGMSDDAFGVLDRTVSDVLGRQRGLWLTFGLAFALWQVSSAIRAAIGSLNLIYGADEERGMVKRVAVSLALALAVMPLLVVGIGAVGFGGRLVSALELGLVPAIGVTILRLGLAVPLLFAAVLIVLHWAPAAPQRMRWASMGTVVIVGGWVLTTLLYGLYVAQVASYETVFGPLASVIVLMTYVYILSVVFLAGAQLDVLLRERIEQRGD